MGGDPNHLGVLGWSMIDPPENPGVFMKNPFKVLTTLAKGTSFALMAACALVWRVETVEGVDSLLFLLPLKRWDR